VSIVSFDVVNKSMSNIDTLGVMDVASASSWILLCRTICHVSLTLGVQSRRAVGEGSGDVVEVGGGLPLSSPESSPRVRPRPRPSARARTVKVRRAPTRIFRRNDHDRRGAFLSSIVSGYVDPEQVRN
jgi:hypothetical protein